MHLVIAFGTAKRIFLTIDPNTPCATVAISTCHLSSYVFAQSDEVLSQLTLAAKQAELLSDKALAGVARIGMVFEGDEINHLHSKLLPMHGADSTFNQIDLIYESFITRYEGYLSTYDWG
ncbi:diadenosine tetraphosphate (Ap4A) HIT family hydrolase [Chitinivorax tropicus]|uniref:Diadenosine tetraphosphate (Ap4A) HIT family hydrolase n=1 Tax=Chitinivorax tropicus TaxID=714531 RepID=A0A840MFT2_9PROT|nr:diadenosine tetraphosphate (Ap4A) HIT family hydrolase [Chitinivorax tropicus]